MRTGGAIGAIGLHAPFAFVEAAKLETVDGARVVITDSIDLLPETVVVRAVVGVHDLLRDLLDSTLELLTFSVHVILLCFQHGNEWML